jgi:6-pyruvoyltetrahydropterin/6-carboxytetrahydropterin synthase
MYELTVERVFSAAHAIVMKGEQEPLHGHDWRVRLTVAGERLDADGLLCDFHLLEREVDRVVSAFRNRNLNETPPFDRVNPTAEHVARHIASSVGQNVPPGVIVRRVSVTEAPGREATWMA